MEARVTLAEIGVTAAELERLRSRIGPDWPAAVRVRLSAGSLQP